MIRCGCCGKPILIMLSFTEKAFKGLDKATEHHQTLFGDQTFYSLHTLFGVV